MNWNHAGLAGLLVGLVIELHPVPADACGIKLTVKTSTPRKAVARSSNPSHLLLLGTPPRRLERELASKGHDVEVSSDVSGAKRKSYAVVMVVDPGQADTARSTFPDAVVVVRSGDVAADVTSVEKQVARRPTRVDESRTVVAARVARRPVAVGPTPRTGRPIVTAKQPEETPAVAKPDPTPTPPTPIEPKAVTTQPTPVVETAPVKRPEATEPRPTKQKATAAFRDEVYFTVGSSTPQRNAALARAVKWLTANADVQVVIEGHADPTGTPENNLALSQTRAEGVRDHLVSNGIDASRLEVVSYGDTRLKYGRRDARNRRVAIEPKR